MPITVETRDSSALTDADLDEMASMGGAFDIGLLSKAKEDWVLATTAREGERLRTIILQKLQAMHEVVRNHAERAPELLRLYEARLQERLRQAAESPLMDMKLPMEETLARIRQEVALHGMKTDVVEELQRLAIHLQEFEAILQRGGPVGRKLDFLLQELNREANTLGSKSADLPSTAASLELKLLIEQVREQIQNLE